MLGDENEEVEAEGGDDDDAGWVLVWGCRKRVGGVTYNQPRVRIRRRAIFWRMAIWRVQIWRTGRAATRRSVVMLSAALAWYMLCGVSV